MNAEWDWWQSTSSRSCIQSYCIKVLPWALSKGIWIERQCYVSRGRPISSNFCYCSACRTVKKNWASDRALPLKSYVFSKCNAQHESIITPYPPLFNFGKIKLEISSSTNWILSPFRTGFLQATQAVKIQFEID